jgi:PAS domain S-box-containing protein
MARIEAHGHAGRTFAEAWGRLGGNASGEKNCIIDQVRRWVLDGTHVPESAQLAVDSRTCTFHDPFPAGKRTDSEEQTTTVSESNPNRGPSGFARGAARMGAWSLYLHEDRVAWSAELEDVFGIAPGTFRGTRAAFHALVYPADLPRLLEDIERSLRSGEEYCVIFRYLHGSGEWRWMEGRGLPVFDASGKPLRIDGIGIDVTDRTLAEHTRSRLAAIVESSDDAILSKTLDGLITSWNAGATRLFGYTAEEMVGHSIMKLIPPELHPEEREILEKLRRGERIEHSETRRVARDGSLVEVSLSVSPVRDVTGAIVGASTIARDISGQRRTLAERERLLDSERNARAQAERLGHLKDEFLATLSHELRTPLTAIMGWATLLKRHATLPESQVSAAIETIYRNAKAQAQIIDDLLDMSRIVSGKIRLQTAAVDLMDLVQVSVDGIRPAAAARQIRLDVAPARDAVLVAGDAGRLQQVLWNLLTNAVKFTPAGGRITVHVGTSEGQATVRVEDTGAGIDPAFLPHVFERFRQADGSTTREHGGLGLGLSIVRNLVELHGGTVAAASTGQGNGSSFTVRLPMLNSDSLMRRVEDGGGTRAPLEPHAVLDGIRVLVVDDEADGRALLARLMRDAGATVHEAASATAAMKLLEGRRVDVILSDISMPEVDGFEFIRRVRALPDAAASNTPAIAVTAYARQEDRERSLLAGFQQHVAKPYSFPELATAIATLRKGRAH